MARSFAASCYSLDIDFDIGWPDECKFNYMSNAYNTINKEDERCTETPDDLMEDNGEASKREEDLESISW